MNAYFEALLETGVDEMAWDDLGDDNVSQNIILYCNFFLEVCLQWIKVFIKIERVITFLF